MECMMIGSSKGEEEEVEEEGEEECWCDGQGCWNAGGLVLAFSFFPQLFFLGCASYKHAKHIVITQGPLCWG